MSGEAIEIPKSLRLDVCPFCGYSLNGLPAEGICPECGKKYDSSEIVLHGYGRGQHENAATAKKSRIFWLLLAPVGYFVFMGYSNWNRMLADPFFILLLLIFVFRHSFRLMRRSQTWHPGLVQVRLNARGCTQFDDLSDTSFLREFVQCYSGFAVVIVAAVAWIAIFAGWLPLGHVWIFFGVFVVIALSQGLASRRYLKALSRVRDGSAINLNMALVKRALWPYAKGFSLDRQSDQAWRLRIAHSTIDWPVDAEIELTPEQAEDLRRWLSDRMPQAVANIDQVPQATSSAESSTINA